MNISEQMKAVDTEKQAIKTYLKSIGYNLDMIPFSMYHNIINGLIALVQLNTDYYVSVNGDDSNDGLKPSTAFLTLNKAVTTASDGQSIGVLAGTYTGTSNCNLTISKNLTITGEDGTIFDGENTRKSGWTLNSVVNITQINFQNGSSNYGGAIYNNNGGNIINCTFDSNISQYGGSGIFNKSIGNVSNCIFTNNTSSSGAILNGSTGSISNCTFDNNTASYKGGGITNYSTGTIVNCIFRNNSAQSGGAISRESTGEIIDCTFSNNTASSSGGTILNMSGGAINNCDFLATTSTNIYNDTIGVTIDGCYWNTATPTSESYNSTLNGTVPTNDRTTPNHPERITS